VAVSATLAKLTGVPDFDVDVYGLGVLTSKRFAWLNPYLGIRQSLAIGRETTAKVDLKTERVPVAQGIIGAGYSIWRLGIVAEYDLSTVNTFGLVLGFQPRPRPR
jgi:hypothetical protein